MTLSEADRMSDLADLLSVFRVGQSGDRKAVQQTYDMLKRPSR